MMGSSFEKCFEKKIFPIRSVIRVINFVEFGSVQERGKRRLPEKKITIPEWSEGRVMRRILGGEEEVVGIVELESSGKAELGEPESDISECR
ncbi:hypothetical protein Tco_0877526 [Tanacetum coccineum]|uniref:Uncharacterized protein n=1 Tax=Tanacetum coccineum TaxID=301880 RepID=A0ABQ5BVB2_9ASTR